MVLTSAMLFSTVAGVAGCSKKNNGNGAKPEGNGVSSAIVNDVVEIEDDSEWFDYSTKKVSLIANPEKYQYTYIDTIHPTDDGYVVTYQCYGGDEDSESHLVELDKNFDVVSDSKLTAKEFGLRDGTEISINNVAVIGGEIYVSVNSYYYDENTYDYENNSLMYNITKHEEVDVSFLNAKLEEDFFAERSGIGDDGTVFISAYGFGSSSISYKILLGKDGKYVKTIDVGKETSMKEIWMVEFVSTSGNEITFVALGDDRNVYFTVDTTDMSVEVTNEIEAAGESVFADKNGTQYYMDGDNCDGIYADGQLVMPFSSSYVNRNKVQYGTILDASDGHYVVQSVNYTGWDTDLVIYTFDRADSNPNVGKTVLTLGCFGQPLGSTAEAISLFNQNSDKYFLELEIYDIDGGYENVDVHDWQDFELSKKSTASNELTMDLLAGEGPDLILDAAGIAQLNSEEYLYDISGIMDEIGDVEVFDNVIDASKVNGKLFNLPLSFETEGIFALKKDVKGEKGFTFDEYVEYVDKVCNGKSPMGYYGRSEVMRECLSIMSDEFYDEDGNVSFNNQTFYDLSSFLLDNIPEVVNSEDFYEDDEYYGMGVGYSIGEDNPLVYTELYSISSYISACQKYKDEVGFYGIPTNDGRGPSIEVTSSIAISAACSDYEGAKEFIKFFFKDEAKSVWSELYTNPIVVDGCRENSKLEVQFNNKNFETQLKYSSEAELNSWGIFRVDEGIIEDYIDVLKSADSNKTIDPSIYLIVVEEIPAYFKGQKKIEDVAAIIEDRAQTVIDER